MAIYVSDYQTKLNSPNSWISKLYTDEENLNFLVDSNNTVFYTFSLPPVDDFWGGSIKNYAVLDSAAKESVRTAFNYFGVTTGIKFVESQKDATFHVYSGQINDSPPSVTGWRYLYNFYTPSYEVFKASARIEVVLDSGLYKADFLNPKPGSFGYQYILNAIGQGIGVDGVIQIGNIPNSNFSEEGLSALLYLYGGDGIGGNYGYYSQSTLIKGTSKPEVIIGDTRANIISCGGGNDTVIASSGADFVFGGDGVDGIKYDQLSSNVIFKRANGGYTITTGNSETYLFDIERVQFLDKSVALDLDGIGGMAAKILVSLFGKEAALSAYTCGIALYYLESNNLLSSTIKVGIKARFGDQPNINEVVSTVALNVGASKLDSKILRDLSQAINTGLYSIESFVEDAMNSSYTSEIISLIGINENGLSFIPYSG